MRPIVHWLCLAVLAVLPALAQQETVKSYRIDDNQFLYLPLGKISFADSIIEFKKGSPAALEKYSDAPQCLDEPNYKTYRVGNFLSLGCSGSVTVAFTDNGFMNLQGDDLYIFEVGPSREAATVEISEDNITWLYAGTISGGKSSIELSDERIDSNTVFHYLRIIDAKELCNSKSAGADIDAIAAINSVVRLSINTDVLFDVNQFSIKKSAKQTLLVLAAEILKIDEATIVVEGHTDSDGDEQHNMELSRNRSIAVIDQIRAQLGYEAPYDYVVRAFDESKPKVGNTTSKNKQINRRVEITVLPPNGYYQPEEK